MWIVEIGLNRPLHTYCAGAAHSYREPRRLPQAGRTAADCSAERGIRHGGRSTGDIDRSAAGPSVRLRDLRCTSPGKRSGRGSLQLFTNRYEHGVDNYLQVITAQTVLLTNQRNDIDI